MKYIRKFQTGKKLIPNQQYQKELTLAEIPAEFHKNMIINDFSPKYDYLIQGDKAYYKAKAGTTWADISDNTKAKAKLYDFLEQKYDLKGYSDYERQVAAKLRKSEYDYNTSYSQRYLNTPPTTQTQTQTKPTTNFKPLDFSVPMAERDNTNVTKFSGSIKRTGPGVTKTEVVPETAVEKLGNVWNMGINYFKRQAEKTSEETEPVSKVNYTTNTNSAYQIYKPEITGDTIKVSNRKYYLPEVIDLNGITLGARNRGDYTPITSPGGIVTAFNPFKPLESYDVTKIQPTENFIGVDPKGNFKVGAISVFTPGDQLSKTYKNNIDDFIRNPNGSIRYAKWNDNVVIDGKRVGNKDNPNNYVPLVYTINDNGQKVIGSLNLLTKKGDGDGNTFGNITGGRVIMKSGKITKLVSGSVEDIARQFTEMRKAGQPVEFYTLDNGSYNLGLRTFDQKMGKADLNKYDLQNSGGGNFLYIKPKQNTFKEEQLTTPNIRTVNDESYKKGHPLKNSGEGIVLHHTAFTEPSLEGVTKLFQTPNKASSHVVIGYNGERRVFAKPDQVTFHAGESKFNNKDNVNDFMLGVEFQGDTGKTPLTQAQINSFIEYATPIIRQYNIPIENIVSHAQIAPGRKKDISEKEYQRIIQELTKTLYIKK